MLGARNGNNEDDEDDEYKYEEEDSDDEENAEEVLASNAIDMITSNERDDDDSTSEEGDDENDKDVSMLSIFYTLAKETMMKLKWHKRNKVHVLNQPTNVTQLNMEEGTDVEFNTNNNAVLNEILAHVNSLNIFFSFSFFFHSM